MTIEEHMEPVEDLKDVVSFVHPHSGHDGHVGKTQTDDLLDTCIYHFLTQELVEHLKHCPSFVCPSSDG